MSFLFSDEWGTYIGLDSIILSLEGFPGELEALMLALYMAECSNARIHILHVKEDSHRKESIFKKLKEVAFRYVDQLHVKLNVEEVTGEAAKIILDCEDCFDLIIIGGKRRLREELFGSVSSSLIRKSKKPLIAVTSPITTLNGEQLAIQNILIPIRNLEEDRAAMKLAAMLTSSATSRNFLIAALHIITLPQTIPMIAAEDEAYRDEEHQVLKEIGELSNRIARPITPHIVVGRTVEKALVKFAKRYPYDIIILGEREKPGPFKRIIGDKASYIARKAPCAVAIIYK